MAQQYYKNRPYKRNNKKQSFKVWLWVVLLLIVWEAVTRFELTPSYILPPFSNVIVTLCQESLKGKLLIMAIRSLGVLVEALLFNFVLSAIIVLLCQRISIFYSLYYVIANIMNSIPNMALLPLIIMWFGIGDAALVALVTHSVLWTLTIHILRDISMIPQIYRDFANNIELKMYRQVIDIFIPAVLPDIVSGLKIAWGRAWRSLIGAEIVFGAIGSNGGLGYYININRLSGNMSKVLAGVVIIAIIGVIVDHCIFNRLDAIIKKWGMNSE